MEEASLGFCESNRLLSFSGYGLLQCAVVLLTLDIREFYPVIRFYESEVMDHPHVPWTIPSKVDMGI